MATQLWMMTLWCTTLVAAISHYSPTHPSAHTRSLAHSHSSMASSQAAQQYNEHVNSYCSAISCSGSSCSGGFYYENGLTEAECQGLCDTYSCVCFDWRDPNKTYPHKSQPGCRLTYSSPAVDSSGYGYTAYVSTSAPKPVPQASINYACQEGHSNWTFCDSSLSIEQRLDALVQAMTIEEKASQLQARSCPPIDRLGIPFFCWGQNAINGLGPANAFPIPPGMAATFNLSAVKRMGQAIGINARVGFNERTSNHSSGYTCPGSIVTWGATINIVRDPRWGRNFEVPSEDPFVTGAYAVAFTRGAQEGSDRRYTQAIVTIKHLAAYSDNYFGPDMPPQREGGRDRYSFNAVVDDYNFFDTYAPPFEAAVRSGNVRGLMCSYNELNGVPACMSPFLRDLVRSDWNFTGYVTSDTDAISPANNHHNYTHTPLEAVVAGLRDGRCDVESSVGSQNLYADYVAEFVNNDSLNATDVDEAIKDTFRVRMEAGLFDQMAGQAYPNMNISDDASADVAESQRDSLVLLQNYDNILPILKAKSIAMIGPFASGYTDAVKTLNKGGSTTTVNGCSITGNNRSGFQAAVSAAKSADLVLLCLGSSADVEHEYHDRSNITLPGVQQDLVDLVLADNSIGVKTIVVLAMRGALAIDSIKSKAAAIVVAWEYGENGKNGPIVEPVTDALFGLFSPGGRLPITMYPASFIEEMNYFDMSMTNGIGRSYKYFRGDPLWPFGWGLSYCNFSAITTTNGTNVPLQIDVSLGMQDCSYAEADEVLQAYFVPTTSAPGKIAPIRQLFAFQRLKVSKSQKSAWQVTVSAADLSVVDDAGNRSTPPGIYGILITDGVTVLHSFNATV